MSLAVGPSSSEALTQMSSIPRRADGTGVEAALMIDDGAGTVQCSGKSGPTRALDEMKTEYDDANETASSKNVRCVADHW